MNLLLVSLISSALVVNRIYAQTTTAETVTETTTTVTQTECTGQWSDWSICFPGTVSNPTPYRDRIYQLTPSQHEAVSCNTTYSVNYVQTEPCDNPEGDRVEDLAVTDFESSGYYQCVNNRWVNQYMLCNGDDDCDDNSDEYPTNKSGCPVPEEKIVCGLSQAPSTNAMGPLGERYLTGIPGIEHFAAGFDVLTGVFKSDVLSMAGHGSCRRVLIAGDTSSYYRLPQNVASLRQMHDVIVDPGKFYEGGSGVINGTLASLKQKLNPGNLNNDVVERAGLTQSEFVRDLVVSSLTEDQARTYAEVGSYVNTAQITLKDAGSLETTTEFIKRIMDLPYSNFSYSKYMQLIEDFGTHYVSSGKLGGSYSDVEVHSRCWLEKSTYEDFSSVPWRQNLRECVRASFFTRLNPDSSTLPSDCQMTTSGETTTLRQEAVDYYAFVSGGSVATSSDLKFTFSKTTWEAWVTSIVNSPSLNTHDFKLERISNLVRSSSILMSVSDTENGRREAIAAFIDRAIELYLAPYDAQQLCEPCEPLPTDTFEFDDDGFEYEVMNYGTPYITGTGIDYKCHCVYEMPTSVTTCGALQHLATLFSLLLSVTVAYFNLVGY